ncbi:MAG: hypothetical protein K2O17_06370 [Bacteroidaceae bacterium]|nr:hypothetical protein [Bacteroidaceae bacterium]
MKHLFVTLMCILLACSPILAQTQAKDEIPESRSKSLEFLKVDGTFIVKEFYDLQKVKGVGCQVLIMTNTVSGIKMGCLRLETNYRSQYSNDSYIGTLDSDELDACIQSLEYIKNTLLPSNPEVYTEAEYKTIDGVKFGAYFNKGKWTAFVYTKGYTSRSSEFLGADNIDSFIEVMRQAKQLITEKVAK